MCGDLCLDTRYQSDCYCGADIPEGGDSYCCIPMYDHCTFEFSEYGLDTLYSGIKCSNGTVNKKSEDCHGQCYNSYQHSRYIGLDAHYSCPDGQCIPVNGSYLEERCRGVNVGVCSNSTRECNHKLFCHEFDGEGSIRLSTPVQHHYCSFKKTHNNGSYYEDIGRADEEISSVVTTEQSTATQFLTKCTLTSPVCSQSVAVLQSVVLGLNLEFTVARSATPTGTGVTVTSYPLAMFAVPFCRKMMWKCVKTTYSGGM